MNKAYYTLKRETSKYNKYMKWHVEYYRDDKTLLASDWFKTQKAAKQNIELSIYRGKKGFPIGDRMSFTEYEELDPDLPGFLGGPEK